MKDQNAPQNDIWQDDLLGRQRDARFLADFLSRRSKELVEKGEGKSYVLNINSPWGQGKTFFLRRLASQLTVENNLSVYINAWTD
ncbi:MAG: P-loop NTPase fold protein, partial [Rhodomicrobium sp.]